MPEQWEIQTSDERKEDQIINFIIFCEDEVSEPFYFSSFQRPTKIKINTIPNQKSGKLNLDNTIAYCVDNGLIVFENEEYQIVAEHNENVWCVYDRDLENEDLTKIRKAQNVGFNTAIISATNAGLNVAWSNDAFELWILLDFETVPTDKILHRTYIYQRLTAIFQTFHPEIEEFQAIVGNAQFEYKSTLKKRLPFLKYVMPLLKEKTGTAIANAKALAAKYDEKVQFHQRNPCTMVFVLVEKLLAE